MAAKADLSSFPQFQGQRMSSQAIMQQPQVVQGGYVQTLPAQYMQQYVQQPTQYVEEIVEQQPQVVYQQQMQQPQVVYQQQPQQIYVQQQPQIIREREIVEVPVDRVVDRVVPITQEVVRNVPVYVQQPPQIVDRIVETPPQFIETTRHTRDASVRIRLELCPKCRKNPVNQRALQEIRLLSGAPPTQFHTTTQTLNPQPLGAPAMYGAPAYGATSFAPPMSYTPVRTAF